MLMVASHAAARCRHESGVVPFGNDGTCPVAEGRACCWCGCLPATCAHSMANPSREALTVQCDPLHACCGGDCRLWCSQHTYTAQRIPFDAPSISCPPSLPPSLPPPTLCPAAGLLMAPGIRYGRVLQNLLEPPLWAMSLRPTPFVKLMVQGGFALQLMITPLWITTMTDVLRIPDAALSYLRGMLMLLVALLQTALVPYLLQVRETGFKHSVGCRVADSSGASGCSVCGAQGSSMRATLLFLPARV